MLIIAIDGACRRNGKPDCVAAGGVFVMQLDSNLQMQNSMLLSNYEVGSTNQRGELLALLTALDHVIAAKQPAQIITDSEYLFNTMTKEWYHNWSCKGWVTSCGEDVKNKDIWLEIMQAYALCSDVTFYHIKGHCIPFGKVTALKLLEDDPSGMKLYRSVLVKYDSVKDTKQDIFEQVNELSIKNNGFVLTPTILKRFVVTNTVADAVATKCVETADALMK